MRKYGVSLTLADGRLGIAIRDVEVMYEGDNVTLAKSDGHGWRRCTEELFDSRDDAVVQGIHMLKSAIASAENASNHLLIKELGR